MLLIEERKDLFNIPSEYYLVQCISSDFAMGKGIAVQFNERLNIKNKLISKYNKNNWNNIGYCLIIDKVINLVTKEKYWNKPTYKTLEESLIEMKEVILLKNIKKLAMPKIGCGLDKLEWVKVKNIIKNIFKDLDIEILVCYL